MQGDALRLAPLLRHLLIHCIWRAPAGGSVRVHLVAEADYVKFRISRKPAAGPLARGLPAGGADRLLRRAAWPKPVPTRPGRARRCCSRGAHGGTAGRPADRRERGPARPCELTEREDVDDVRMPDVDDRARSTNCRPSADRTTPPRLHLDARTRLSRDRLPARIHDAHATAPAQPLHPDTREIIEPAAAHHLPGFGVSTALLARLPSEASRPRRQLTWSSHAKSIAIFAARASGGCLGDAH